MTSYEAAKPWLVGGQVELMPYAGSAVRRWYPTVAVGRWVHGQRDVHFYAFPPFHLKEMGTRFTACGQNADSWVRLWDMAVPEHGDRLCSSCRRVAGL